MGMELVKRELDKVELAGRKVWANGASAIVSTEASLKDVENALLATASLDMNCRWWIGDIVNQAEAIFGEQYHAIESLVADKTGMELETIQRHRKTAQRYAIGERMPCDISKHRMLENLPKGERKKLLKRVIEDKLTANDIRDILRAKKSEKNSDKHQYMLAKWNIRDKEIDMGSLYEMLSDPSNRNFTKEEFERLGLADMTDTSTVYVIIKKPIVDPDEPAGPLVDDDEEVEDIVEQEITEGLVEQATEIILKTKRASISHLQRRLRVGYIRASGLMDELETRGIVGPPKEDGSPRDVLVKEVKKEERAF